MAYHQDHWALVDDLEQVGWEVLLTRASDRVLRDVENRMKDAVCLWLYGVTIGQRPRDLRLQASSDELFMLRAPDDVEKNMRAREAFDKIKSWTEQGEQTLDDRTTFLCDECERLCKNRVSLSMHMLRCHYIKIYTKSELIARADLRRRMVGCLFEAPGKAVPGALLSKWNVTSDQLFDARAKVRQVVEECL